MASSYVGLINQALQKIGTRTTVTQQELDDQSTNEAIQATLIYTDVRNRLQRMAPWSCVRAYTNLSWITAQAGTPENTSPASALWAPGLPPPPWLYEYQYPRDCARALFIVPQFQTGLSQGVPIFPVTTGGSAAYSQGPPIKFAVATDEFYRVDGIFNDDIGSGYAVGDIVEFPRGPSDEAPIGAPTRGRVLTIGVGGAVSVMATVDTVWDEDGGGSYFNQVSGTQAATTITGSGTGYSANFTYYDKDSQRVILTNQENAVLAYCKIVENVNVWDPMFQDAYQHLLAATLGFVLNGDKSWSNNLVEMANAIIVEARKADGNEGLTVNDVTPDFIRVRGIDYPGTGSWPGNQGFDWGALWATW